MVPNDLLSFSFTDHEIVPHYFTDADHGWLRALVDIYELHEGKSRGELDERLSDPLPVRAPLDKLKIARHVLHRLYDFELHAAVAPREARAVLFEEGSRHARRESAVRAACARLGAEPEPLLASLLADLPARLVVVAPQQRPSLAEIAQRANLALVGGLLRRALAVSVRGGANLRRVVRQAKLKGLLCVVRRAQGDRRRDQLEISGPYALFRRTTMYGRALATLVPLAVQCADIELRAACVLGPTEQPGTLVIRDGDPIFPAQLPKAHDSKLEARFQRDFGRLAPEWDLVREPAAVPTGDTLIFPDFELRHRWDPKRRWLLEIAGFWTASYIADKLRHLRAAKLDRLILCIDDERNCADTELPARARVIRFRRHIDPRAVLAIVNG